MADRQQFFQRYGINILKFTTFVFAIFLMCSSARAQTATEQQCFDSLQGKVAWNRAGATNWSESNARSLCKATTDPSINISCFKAVITNFDDWSRGLKECSGLATSFGHSSYESNPYRLDTTKTNSWDWVGTNTRTIYNPLDGGILLKYTFSSQGASDGCSGGAAREKTLFQQPCFAHDTNYDAPFPLAGFPSYANGGSTGQDISDYLFYKDIQLLNNNARAKNDGVTNWVNDSAADLFYTGVVLGGNFRGRSEGKNIISKGGVVAVLNNGAYIMTLKVTWTAPDGTQKTIQVTKPAAQTAVVPLSVGATNITAECWAVAGKTIFKKNMSGPGMYAYTVGGTSLITSEHAGLDNNTKDPVGGRTIKFFNQAGYVASMMVMFFVNQDMGNGTKALMPKTLFTEKITAGISKSVVIPADLAPNTKINVSIQGYGTLKNDVFSTTVSPDFTGEVCFKAWGTLFSPQGGGC